MTAWRTALRTEWMNPDPSSVVPSQSSGSPMVPPLSSALCLLPPPETWGRHLPPETNQALKGKPETGINASVICPQLIIRFPHAAPFEFCNLPRGRDVIAITSVRGRRQDFVELSQDPTRLRLRLRTAAMAMAALPYTPPPTALRATQKNPPLS